MDNIEETNLVPHIEKISLKDLQDEINRKNQEEKLIEEQRKSEIDEILKKREQIKKEKLDKAYEDFFTKLDSLSPEDQNIFFKMIENELNESN